MPSSNTVETARASLLIIGVTYLRSKELTNCICVSSNSTEIGESVDDSTRSLEPSLRLLVDRTNLAAPFKLTLHDATFCNYCNINYNPRFGRRSSFATSPIVHANFFLSLTSRRYSIIALRDKSPKRHALCRRKKRDVLCR